MSNTENKSVTIIGAGLAGSYLAILLAKRGYTVNVYERFTQEEIMGNYSAARSYNLTFYSYGAKAIKEAGVWEAVEPFLVIIKGCIAQISTNSPVRYVNDTPLYTIKRNTLLEALIKKATTYPKVTYYFGKSFITVNRSQKEIVVQDVKTKKYLRVPCTVLFGADGVNSLVRTELQKGQTTTHIQEYATWEYKQIHIDDKQTQKLELEKDFMYVWTRKDTFLLAHPNTDHSFSALLVLPKNTTSGFSSLQSPAMINMFIKNHYSDLLPIADTVVEEISKNPISNFVTVMTTPWYYKNFIAIIGDAAHGFNPFYGQGVSAGFGDCLTLAKLLDDNESNWEVIFKKYQKARKRHTDALAILSKDTIKRHLRHKRADYDLIYDKIDTILYHVLPKVFAPPAHELIPLNPSLSGDYMERHENQRRKAKYIAIPVVVGFLTGVVALYEIVSNTFSKKRGITNK